MEQAGVVGLGDMGSGLAKNLIGAGFAVRGFDISETRMTAFAALGGIPAESAGDAGAGSTVVFVMVMTGAQAKQVIFGGDRGPGLVSALKPGGTIVLTATIKPSEAREIGEALDGTGIALVDSPVSGGYPGAQNGTLTMMAAGSEAALANARPAMQAVSRTIHRVGAEPGMGQTVKACLQSLMGPVFSATFEATVLAAKAGVSGDVLYKVVSTSGAGCAVVNTALENIIDRRFEGTGSHIDTMYKDLTIALDMARELGVPLFSTALAMQLFQAGKTRYPAGDNWVVTRILEEVVDTGLER